MIEDGPHVLWWLYEDLRKRWDGLPKNPDAVHFILYPRGARAAKLTLALAREDLHELIDQEKASRAQSPT